MAFVQLASLILANLVSAQGHTFQGFASWTKSACCARDISARNGEIMSQAGVGDNNLYWWNGTVYKLTNGAGLSVGASPDGWHWMVGLSNQLFRFNGSSKLWEAQANLTGMAQVSALSKDKDLVRKMDNSIAYCDNGTCTAMKGMATWVGIGQNDERWMIGYPDKGVWRWNAGSQQWIQMPGENAKRIDVLGPNAVAVVAQNNTVYLWENGNWSPIKGSSCEWATLDAGRMWCTQGDAKIYYGEFLGSYPSAAAPTSAFPSPDIGGAMNGGQCQVTVSCPYIPAPATAGSCNL